MADAKLSKHDQHMEYWKDASSHSWASPIGLSLFFVIGHCVPLLCVGVFLVQLHEAGLI